MKMKNEEQISEQIKIVYQEILIILSELKIGDQEALNVPA